MGTRANFKVILDDNRSALFYTGSDGYPDGLGTDLVAILGTLSELPDMNSTIEYIENCGYEHVTWGLSGDIEYYYEVFPKQDKVSAYSVDWRTGTQTLIKDNLKEIINR